MSEAKIRTDIKIKVQTGRKANASIKTNRTNTLTAYIRRMLSAKNMVLRVALLCLLVSFFCFGIFCSGTAFAANQAVTHAANQIEVIKESSIPSQKFLGGGQRTTGNRETDNQVVSAETVSGRTF